MIGATALLSTGMINHDHGITISQRLIKANNDFEPPKKKKYNPIKNVNDRLWGYFEEFQDYVHIGDSVQLRSIIKECPNFTHYFELYDKRLNELLVLYNQFIEHARLGEHIGVMQVFKSCPEFTHLVHSFVENIDVKKQCNALHLLARKKDSPQLMQYVRNHSEMVSTMSAKFDKIQASSTRAERVAEFNDLLERVREGDNASIRVLRRTDPHITRDIADIIECDRLIHFDTMLVCALEGNASYMAYLVDLHPHLVNYISEQGESILLNAVKNQHLSTVKALTNCDFNTTDRLGRSALHITCEGLMKPLAHYFIHNGANVDAIDKRGYTPLHYVCDTKKPSVTMIKMLIAGQAKINISNKVNMTCLDLLEKHGHDTLCNYVKSLHKKERARPAVFLKSERQQRKDLLCREHWSYSCPCAVRKMKHSRKRLAGTTHEAKLALLIACNH